jgi:polyhydroxyalkanoate synthesis regulator phasin
MYNENLEILIDEIIEKTLSNENAKELLSDINKLDRFVTNCKYENDDFMNGKISTEESITVTDEVWESIGGDNLYKNRGWVLR